MEKNITAVDARRSFGEIIQDILVRGSKYVIERHGKPVAVVVPVEVYEQWKETQERFFETLHAAQANANLSEAEADQVAKDAVKLLRTH